MFVMGVNHDKYDNSLKIGDSVSCIANCLAPLAKIIQDHFVIMEGLHAITVAYKTVDGPSGKLGHDGHGAAQSIIPAFTGAAKGYLTCHLEKAAKYEYIKIEVKQASEGPLKGTLGYTENQVVCCDINSDSHFSTSDAGAGFALNDSFVKIIPGMTMNMAKQQRVDFMAYMASKE
ncbi:hypothetical protein U0070_000722 [Myodes glareolus]|uniref:glyceraldehyde-3-phosphate dehydrogenase (phosphorylating) n=1 Tax=Myodes glareolus TaxID=447135 RepID=A0AAW0J6G7_MYOGA